MDKNCIVHGSNKQSLAIHNAATLQNSYNLAIQLGTRLLVATKLLNKRTF